MFRDLRSQTKAGVGELTSRCILPEVAVHQNVHIQLLGNESLSLGFSPPFLWISLERTVSQHKEQTLNTEKGRRK